MEAGNQLPDRSDRCGRARNPDVDSLAAMNFREKLSLPDDSRRDEATRLLTMEFFNVQAQFSRIRGYAEVTPEAVNAAADAIYRKQVQITNWLLDMPGSERYFGDKSAFRAAGKHLISAKYVADAKISDAATFSRSSAFVFAHSVLDGSISTACEASVLLKPADFVGYIENQQVTLADIQLRTPQELILDRTATLVHRMSRDSIVRRMERLLSVLKPGKEYDGLQDYILDLGTIEAYDRTRQEIIHERKFDIPMDRLEDAMLYMEKSFLYFAFLVLWRHGERFNKGAWREVLKIP
jgi:hypothetical protein